MEDSNPTIDTVIVSTSSSNSPIDDSFYRKDSIMSNENDTVRVSFSKASSTVDIDRIDSCSTMDHQQSAYEEVAANVSNKDDPNILVLTFRSWLIGLTFTCLLSFVNQFFWYRTSPLIIGVLVAQLLSHLLGKLMARFLPTRQWKCFRWSFSLNPGPFTVKEHCIITTMANAASVS
jgi:hypothetical protein